MKKIQVLLMILVMGVVMGCMVKDVADVLSVVTVVGIADLFVPLDIREKKADEYIRNGTKRLAQGERKLACSSFKKAAEKGNSRQYIMHCDANWKPEE